MNKFYVYGVDFLAVAIDTTVTKVINIQSDVNFVLQKLCCYVNTAAAAMVTNSTRPYVNATILITDTGLGEQLMSQAIPLHSIFGWGDNPFILPIPRRFMSNTAISIAIFNDEPTNALDIRLALIGQKEFPNAPRKPSRIGR